MSGSLITAVNYNGGKFQTTIKNSVKKSNGTEIQASPILLLTVEYPQNGKLPANFSKHNVQTIQLDESVQKADSIPYSLLQLSNSVLKSDGSYETFEGEIEVSGDKLNPDFGPVLVIRNEGPTDLECTGRSEESLSKEENSTDQTLLDNFLFSPLPKSVVCTVMSKDARENTSIENSMNCDISSDINDEENQMERFEDSSSNLSDEESVHVISDKPVRCRALASLPVNFLYFGRTATKQYRGVFAKKEIPNKSRFGPMEGILIPFNTYPDPGEGLQLSIETNGYFERLLVSNEDLSNWMKYVLPADSVDEQNLNLHQSGKHLYFSAIKTIQPGEELRAWYSSSYAKPRNLRLLTNRKRNLKRGKVSLGTKTQLPCGKENISDPTADETPGSKWKCTHCQRVFKSATLFNLHVLTHAADNLEINENCKKLLTLSPAKNEDSNAVTSKTKKIFRCSHCSKTFPKSSSLALHLRTHPSTTEFNCPICKQVFFKVPHFREHIRTHAVDGVFSCPHCPKKFSKYKHIRGHMRRFHCEKNFVCMQCPKRFSTLDKLKTHLVSHSDFREFTCACCGKQFKRKDKLSSHVKRKICDVKKLPNAETQKKQPTADSKCLYRCHICAEERRFKRRGMLVNHLAIRHPEVPPDSIPELNLPIFKESKDYYCQYCGKIYKSSTKRKAHIVKNHPGKQLPPSKISLQESKNTSENIDTYSLTVGSVKKMPQSCPWCYKQYSSKAKLLQHQRKKHPTQMPKTLLQPKRPRGYSLDDDPVRDAVEKVTDSDMFLSDPLEYSEYELSVGEGEFIIDTNILKRAMKYDVLPSDCSPETLAELGQILEAHPDSYFKVYQGPSGITVAHPVEVWDPMSLCLSPPPPPSHLLPSST